MSGPQESKKVYDGTLFDVLVEQWGDNEREIVEHPGSVTVVAVDRHDRVVLVKQFREPARSELLELPAGTLEEGESPLESAKRELKEETGLHGGEWSEGPVMWTTPGFVREHMRLFFAEGVEEGEPETEEDEDIALVRIPLAELADRLEQLEDAKTIAGLALLLRRRGL